MSNSGGKRKRDEVEQIKVKAASNTDFIPIIATTPGVQIPQNTQLTAYSRPKAKRAKSTGPEYIVHGSSEKVDYEGRELEEDAQLESYYIGIYDPKTGEVEVHPAPRVHVRREIKAYKEKDARTINQNSGVERFASARAVLGAEFGTKKSKKAIERRDLNQIQVKEMDSAVTTSIVTQIGENTESMPTREDLENEHEASRLLPPHKTEGISSPSEVYNLDDIITKDEMDMIWVKDWYDSAKSGSAVYVQDNTHISHRINKLGLAKNQSATNTRRLKILKYVSILRNMYTFFENRKDSERLLLAGKIMDIKKKIGVSEELCTILLRKFTEILGGGSDAKGDKPDLKPRMKATPASLAKILNYLAILALMAEENYQVDIYYLKDDLGLQAKDVLQVFSNVGCKRKDMPPIQADALGIPKAEVKLHKIAYLTAKPEFPKPRTRKKAAAKR